MNKSRREKQKKRGFGRALWRAVGWLLPAAVALVLYLVLPSFPKFTETVFSRGIHHFLTGTVGWLISRIPVSLTELVVLAIVPTLLVLFGFGVAGSVRAHRARKKGAPRRRTPSPGFVRALRGLGWTASCILLAYMLLHGVNYYRLPAATLCDLPADRTYSDEQVLRLCVDLADKASAERAALAEDENGCMRLAASLYDTLRQAGDGYETLDDRYPFLNHPVRAVKPVLISHLWSYTGTAGVYCPVFLEANVNIDQPAFAVPLSAAHELAHVRGFAREDECNFFGCLSCFEHPSADYRYSGYMLAFIYTYNELLARDPALCRQADDHCSAAVKRDLAAQNAYWDSFEGGVQDLASALNDSFIESQGVEAGIDSYDRVVDLLLAYFNP